jgi:outer membrane protein TolC
MANLQRIFPRIARQALWLSGLSAVSLLLLAGCATGRVSPSQPPPKIASQPNAPAAVQASPQPDSQRSAPANPITVEAAIERATACSLQIKALRAAVAVAKQRRSAATDIEDPEAVVKWGNVDDLWDGSGNTQNSDSVRRVGGRFHLPNPFLVVPRVSARRADLEAAQADLEAARWLVECDVRRLIAEIQYLSEDTALTVELVHQNDEILKDTRALAGQGAATAFDMVSAVHRQLRTQNDLDQTRHRLQLAQMDLAALLDLPSASPQLTTNAPPTSPLAESAIAVVTMQRAALQHRGDVAALHWRSLAAQSAYREARNVRIPWVKEFEAVEREPVSGWWMGITVNVPIFSWTKNHAEDVQMAQSNLAEVNEANGTQLVCREIRDAVNEIEERFRQQKRNQSEVAPLIAEMRQTLQLLKQTPNLTPYQVAATEAEIIESVRLELGSRWLYHLAQLNLERVLGEPLCVALHDGEGKM